VRVTILAYASVSDTTVSLTFIALRVENIVSSNFIFSNSISASFYNFVNSFSLISWWIVFLSMSGATYPGGATSCLQYLSTA